MATTEENCATVAEVSPPTQEIFSLTIFETLDKSQNTHGVMHEDYHQYHQFCTNRLFRLRHAKPVRSDLVHNSKYVVGEKKKRNAYCSRISTKQPPKGDDNNDNNDKEEVVEAPPAIIGHENHLWVPLYQAERSWAQACEVQKQKRANKTQQLVLRKLRKALKFVATLQELASRTCDETTQQEIDSYAGWMKGNYSLQKQDYTAALDAYRSSMSILLTLAQTQQLDDDPKSLVLADLWTTRAESVLRPLVRFCQYECKDTTPDLAMETTTSASTTTASSSEIIISFRGKDTALDSYKDLCVLYLKAEALQKQLQEGTGNNEASFISLLSLYDDGIAFIETELVQYHGIQAGPAVNAKKEELGYLEGYFQYQKLNKSLHKNQERLTDCHSDPERVHVYDALLQNAQAMTKISAGGSSSGGGGARSGPEQEEAQAHVLRIRALRCCSLAKVYLVSLHQPQEAKTLWKQATTLTKRAIEELAACDTRDKQHEKEIETYLEELEALEKTELAVLEIRVKAALYLRNSGASTGFTAGTDRPLWMRLEEFDPGVTGGSLVDVPPRAIPIPCKPVFYDIAWRYYGGCFPIEELEEQIENLDPKVASGGGIFGWLSGK